MQPTDLVTMRVWLHGWFDTGRTSVSISVSRCHYDPEAANKDRITEKEEIRTYEAEVFLTDDAESEITRQIGRAFSDYAATMMLP